MKTTKNIMRSMDGNLTKVDNDKKLSTLIILIADKK